MMNIKLLIIAISVSFLLSACQQKDATGTGAAIDKSEAVAVVNGKMISKKDFQALKDDVQKRTGGQEFPNEQLLDELIKRELLLQEAKQKKLADTDEVKTNLEAVRKTILTQAAMQDFLKTNVISDEELKAEYDSKIGAGKTEYKARHILLKTEEEAKALIEKLNEGGDFVQLAKENSIGPSAGDGGDLGWFMPQQMVPPFSEAVIALENGKYTAEPVQTNFGWHVILREDSRAQKAPEFEAVKEQLRPLLQRQKLQEYLTGLRNNAKVEILLEEEKEQAADAPAETEATGEEAESSDQAEPADEADAPEEGSATEEQQEEGKSATEESAPSPEEKTAAE